MTRRTEGKRTKPDVSSLLSLFLSGLYVTVHDRTSGEYRNPSNPSGWSHATFALTGVNGRIEMLPKHGEQPWAFARIHDGKAKKLPQRLMTPKSPVQRERMRIALAVLRYFTGERKTLPANVDVKAPAPCARPGCGRTLSTGQSLTLRVHPTWGPGFYGPVCFMRGREEATRREQGMARMNALLANAPANASHNPDCPCSRCK